ncbi:MULTISPECIES: phosphopantetheine-binding protein [Halomonas]|uniref:Phosphopantetheine-binding protein n=1 Tax=Halomonas sp. H10-59 TaxID=2950874 RepID=A0AAU7KTI9_9GAMM|nr:MULTISPECIES: phosphopantetheine-binding protein [Halomonas]MBR9772186.1 acyl carrier protein [Gammaproteobacteria bacterium]KJZ09972.1 acyl carrier protein [Halomonas sp. S2151]MBY5942488.1 acyl carrier protein [Halomonas sp. DP5N14-9]MBY6112413.1 acyl carrier protein [Halomonas sp. DP1Y21-3]MCO7216667.1 phosphopantetheine-binding protein [Halomonas sp. OfavH-34-E]
MNQSVPLSLDLKHMIIDTLELEDVTPEDIDDHAPLFGEGLGLDSIDALELGLALQKRYGVTLDAEAEDTRRHFASLAALQALVEERRVN